MARKLTVAAAQTGPVLGGMQDGVEAACAMVKEGARKGVDIICFPEVFLAPFFPNRLIQDYEKHFLTLPNPVTDPLFAVAREHKVMLVFGYAERFGLEMDGDKLQAESLEWATTRGARSGRTAWQYIQDLAGRLGKQTE